MTIQDNYKRIKTEVPDYVTIVAAAKTRTAEEVRALINAGATDIGENYVQETKKLFDRIASIDIPGVEMDTLSMGMSNAYKIAIEEGSTMIRPGTILFGARASDKCVGFNKTHLGS